MDNERYSAFPHLAWLGYEFEAPASAGTCCWNLNGHAHSLHMVFSGPQRVRWISRGQETDYTVKAGSFHFLPADREQHTIVANPAGPIRSSTVFVPPQHLAELAASDQMEHRVEFRRLLVHDDPVLQACMQRLASRASADDEAMEAERTRLLAASCCG